MGKFKPGDRVVMHSIPKKDEDGWWRNGAKAIIATEPRSQPGYVPSALDMVGSPSYGIHFEGYTYDPTIDENWHTAGEAILEMAGEFEEELNAAIESIKSVGHHSTESPGDRELRAKMAQAWDEGHRGLCRRHGVMPFEACRNPYRDEP